MIDGNSADQKQVAGPSVTTRTSSRKRYIWTIRIVYMPSEPRAMFPLMSEEVGVVRPPRSVANRAITHDQYATIGKSFGEFPC
jgi:hypothetical protein